MHLPPFAPSTESESPAALAVENVLASMPAPLAGKALRALADKLGLSVSPRSPLPTVKRQVRQALTHLGSARQLAEFIRNEARHLIGQANSARNRKDPIDWYLRPSLPSVRSTRAASDLVEQAIMLAYVANGLDEAARVTSCEPSATVRRRSQSTRTGRPSR